MHTKFGLKKLETSLNSVLQKCFDILNRLAKDHECGGQTDGPAAVNNSAVYRPALKRELIGCTESNRIVFFSYESPIMPGTLNAPSTASTIRGHHKCDSITSHDTT